MRIEVTVRSLEVRKQTTKAGRELHWQKVGMEQENDWPVVFELFRPEGSPLPLGKHQVHLVFQSSQYNQLEVNPFDIVAVPSK